MTERYGAARVSKIRARIDRMRRAAMATDDPEVLEAWLGLEPYLGLIYPAAREKA